MDYIGPYRLLKLIRSGSRTHVWEAMNSADNQRVAIKSLQPDYRKDRQELTALKHEYEVGSSLDHANINRVFEFDVTRGVPYVVMDYFNAPNLKQSIRQFPDRVRENLVSIVEQAAAGLQHLHERGWIHRDIKPDNYLMDETCEVRLIDFAISQKIKKKSALGSLFGGKAPIVGTRSYMSPEQIKGEHLEPSSDIYSLGCVIFELFCRRVPFTGNTADELLTKHLRNPPPSIASMNPDATSDFSKLVLRMMAKKPEERPQSVSEFLEEAGKMRMIKLNA